MEARTATAGEQAKAELHGGNIIAAIKASGVEFVLLQQHERQAVSQAQCLVLALAVKMEGRREQRR